MAAKRALHFDSDGDDELACKREKCILIPSDDGTEDDSDDDAYVNIYEQCVRGPRPACPARYLRLDPPGAPVGAPEPEILPVEDHDSGLDRSIADRDLDRATPPPDSDAGPLFGPLSAVEQSIADVAILYEGEKLPASLHYTQVSAAMREASMQPFIDPEQCKIVGPSAIFIDAMFPDERVHLARTCAFSRTPNANSVVPVYIRLNDHDFYYSVWHEEGTADLLGKVLYDTVFSQDIDTDRDSPAVLVSRAMRCFLTINRDQDCEEAGRRLYMGLGSYVSFMARDRVRARMEFHVLCPPSGALPVWYQALALVLDHVMSMNIHMQDQSQYFEPAIGIWTSATLVANNTHEGIPVPEGCCEILAECDDVRIARRASPGLFQLGERLAASSHIPVSSRAVLHITAIVASDCCELGSESNEACDMDLSFLFYRHGLVTRVRHVVLWISWEACARHHRLLEKAQRSRLKLGALHTREEVDGEYHLALYNLQDQGLADRMPVPYCAFCDPVPDDPTGASARCRVRDAVLCGLCMNAMIDTVSLRDLMIESL